MPTIKFPRAYHVLGDVEEFFKKSLHQRSSFVKEEPNNPGKCKGGRIYSNEYGREVNGWKNLLELNNQTVHHYLFLLRNTFAASI
jgi:hypothetical protein